MIKKDDKMHKMGILADTDLIVFYPELAVAFDVCSALLIQQIHYLTETNPAIVDGQKWYYHSYEAWAERLRCFGTRTVANALRELEAQGVVDVGVFNTHKYDKTRWYRINYEVLAEKLTAAMGTHWKVFHHPTGKIFLMVEEKNTQPIHKNKDETKKETKDANALGKEIKDLTYTGKENNKSPLPPFNGVNEMGNVNDILSKMQEKKAASLSATPIATKPADVVTRWKQHLSSEGGVKPLTAQEAGQLGHIYKGAPQEAIAIVDYIHTHWDLFLKKVNTFCGLDYKATKPSIGIACKHYDIARQLIAAGEAKKNLPKLQSDIDKPAQVVETTPKENLATPEQIAASLALFSKVEED